MPYPLLIRQKLLEFLGTPKFRKFVKQLPYSAAGTRLRYWQEEAWEQFVSAHPDFELTYEQIIRVFRICWLHGTELEQKAIPVRHGCVDYGPDYWRIRERRFPCAPWPFFSTEGREMTETMVVIWYCTVCEKVERDRSPNSVHN